jgi:branched-chain amino acid transport system permease protein
MKTLKKLSWKNILIILVGLFVLIYPLVGANSYIKHLFILFFIWSVVAASWNLLNGYAGINSLGNIGFMAIGGYVSGILAKSLGISPWISIIIGGIVTCILVTIFLGLPALRLSGIYIALLTLIFADTLPSILTLTREITGGAMGLHEIPGFLPNMEKIHAYYICFVFFLIAMFIIYRTIHSRTGLAFMALRDSENFATTLGVNRFNERLKVFAISSFLTGLAGGFYVHSLGDISPSTLGIEPFLLGIAMIELGGIGTFAGPILGAAVIVFGGEFLRLAGTLRLSLLGLLICAIILFFPGGIMQLLSQSESFIRKQIKKRKPAEKVQPT